MKILVLGGGAREHALVLALSRDPGVTGLWCAPGNAGTRSVAEAREVDPLSPGAVRDLALELGVDLVVVGPEAPLTAGVADAVRAAGVACFGPTAAAARLEASKTFAKEVMRAAGVPTAGAESFADADSCARYLEHAAPPYVVKADGLASGKGVQVGTDLAAAVGFARETLAAPGSSVLVEEFLDGPEVSLFVLTDGAAVVPLLPAQDFKRVGDGDAGPNTGGMGAYAPLPWLAGADLAEVMRAVVEPTVAEMARRGTPFAGLLYVGLALTARGPQVVEFNCRFGDPETQAVLALLDSPLSPLLFAAATGQLAAAPAPVWRSGSAVAVVVAAAGYPAAPRVGDPIRIGPLPGEVTVLHAGTASRGGEVVSAGGRVLTVTATGATLEQARLRAYQGVAAVDLPGGHFRSDIAERAAQGQVRVPPRSG